MHSELLACYQQWRRWTEIQRAAVRQSDWAGVHAAQAAKNALQRDILRWSAGLNEADLPRETLRELIEGESEMSQALVQAEAQLRQRLQELRRTSATLKRVRYSYGKRPGPLWISYS